ncbi:cyclin G [Onthophagus taurus]|uniref:cyclin G n=1 Tax=Onthophagus taurus TaxID=166361 RepID=UPI000C202D38|nr:cyclin G [Onthophagus taurus]XP_022915043.1 cyclin G [Onthophagus taurus]
MSRKGKRRSRPVPDANVKQIAAELQKALGLEEKHSIDLQALDGGAIAAREIAVRNLRFLKFYLGLPSEAFFTAVTLLDRFLSKMNVQEKYLSCVSISCLYISCEIHKQPADPNIFISVSQTKCSINDMERMCDIIRKKLDIEPRAQPVTIYSYLNLFLRIFECAATKLNVKPLSSRMLQKKILSRRLEVVMINHVCASVRYPLIALALIQYEIEQFLAAEVPSKSPYYSIEILRFLTVIVDLQSVCMVNAGELYTCYNNVKHVLKHYDDYKKSETKQKMRWQFSLSTLLGPRPLDSFSTNLSRISEVA